MVIDMVQQVVKFFYKSWGYWSLVLLVFIRCTIRIFAQFYPATATNIKQPSGKMTTMRFILLEDLI